MASKHANMAAMDPFPKRTSTITQMAQHYQYCTKAFMKKIEPMVWKLNEIAKRTGIDGKKSPGRYPSLSPREVGFIVDYLEGQDRD